MKLAVVGSGPLAIFCAQHFDLLGAEVTLFQKGPLGGAIRTLLKTFPDYEVVFQGEAMTIEMFWNQFLVPAILDIESKRITRAGAVLRVHKRFLHVNEEIEGKSRLHDLFRVIYSTNPEESILEQVKENPEIFKQLGENVLSSLHIPIESFEDFDLVIDATGWGKPNLSMGAGGSAALNEESLKSAASVYYQKAILEKTISDEIKSIVLVGDHESAALCALKLSIWLKANKAHTLIWIRHTKITDNLTNSWLNNRVNEFLNDFAGMFESEKDIFQTKIHEWRSLEDYVRVKYPEPTAPQPQIILYEGYDVTSLDRLLDREGLFVTIESPDFRTWTKPNDLKTLPCDMVLVGAGVRPQSHIADQLQINEPGFYQLQSRNLIDGMREIKEVEEKIMSFFYRAQ